MSTFPLKQGSRGSQVAEVQAYLNTVAQLVGSNTRIEPDSKFGQRTEDLLYELFKLKEVTEKSYQVMRKASPEAAKRLSTFKQEGGMSPDAMLNAEVE